LTAVMIIVAIFFVGALAIMVKAETKSTERRKINPLGPLPGKSRARTIDGTYILR
jgi:hypothetical protein